MSVNLEYYKAFYHVATLGSMGKAAEVMCLTPPTVTKTIQTLEQQLNCQLFVRSVKGVRLTSAGETLLERVRPGLKLLLAGEQEINMLNSLEGGTIRIAMSEAVVYTFTSSPIFSIFCNRYPKVKLHIKHLSYKETHDAILNGDIDFGILGVFPNESSNLKIYKLYNSPNLAVVGKKYANLVKEPISLPAITELPLIFARQGYSIRQHYEQLYAKYNLKFDPVIEAPHLNMQLQMVKLGLGYSFLPLPYIVNDIAQEELFPINFIGERPFEKPVCLLTSEGIPLSRAAQAMIDLLLDFKDDLIKSTETIYF